LQSGYSLPQSSAKLYGYLTGKEQQDCSSSNKVFKCSGWRLKFIPKTNTRYSVVIKDNAGTVQETDVPLSSDTGTSLSFIASDDKIESTIHAPPML
jgi:hypothetical protein